MRFSLDEGEVLTIYPDQQLLTDGLAILRNSEIRVFVAVHNGLDLHK